MLHSITLIKAGKVPIFVLIDWKKVSCILLAFPISIPTPLSSTFSHTHQFLRQGCMETGMGKKGALRYLGRDNPQHVDSVCYSTKGKGSIGPFLTETPWQGVARTFLVVRDLSRLTPDFRAFYLNSISHTPERMWPSIYALLTLLSCSGLSQESRGWCGMADQSKDQSQQDWTLCQAGCVRSPESHHIRHKVEAHDCEEGRSIEARQRVTKTKWVTVLFLTASFLTLTGVSPPRTPSFPLSASNWYTQVLSTFVCRLFKTCLPLTMVRCVIWAQHHESGYMWSGPIQS